MITSHRVYYSYFDSKTQTRQESFLDMHQINKPFTAAAVAAVKDKWRRTDYKAGNDVQILYTEEAHG